MAKTENTSEPLSLALVLGPALGKQNGGGNRQGYNWRPPTAAGAATPLITDKRKKAVWDALTNSDVNRRISNQMASAITAAIKTDPNAMIRVFINSARPFDAKKKKNKKKGAIAVDEGTEGKVQGRSGGNGSGEDNKGEDEQIMYLDVVLIGVTKSALARGTNAELKNIDGDLILLPSGNVWWPKAMETSPAVPQYKKDAQVVMYFLDGQAKQTLGEIEAKGGSRFENGKMHPELDKVDECLLNSNASAYVKQRYLKECVLGFVPQDVRNHLSATRTISPHSAYFDIPKRLDYATIEKLLADRRVANYVIYMIYLYRKRNDNTNCELKKRSGSFLVSMPVTKDVNSNMIVDLAGIHAKSTINAMLVGLDEKDTVNFNPIAEEPRIVIKSMGVAKNRTRGPKQFHQPTVAIEFNRHFKVYREKLLPIEQYALEIGKFTHEQALEKLHSPDKEDPSLPLHFLFSTKDSWDQVFLEESSACLISLAPFQPTVSTDSPWIQKAGKDKKGKETQAKIKAQFSIDGFQWSAPIIVPVEDQSTSLANQGVMSQSTQEDPSTMMFKVYFNNLERVGGVLECYCEPLSNTFGFISTDVANWPILAPGIFEIAQGGISGYIKYGRSLEIVDGVRAASASLTANEAAFLHSHTVSDANGIPYMLVSAEDLPAAIEIMKLNAPIKTVYYAYGSEITIDYVRTIQALGLKVSKAACEKLLGHKKRPICPLFGQLGGVIGLSGPPEEEESAPLSKTTTSAKEKKQSIALDESKYDFYIIYHAVEKDLKKTVYPLINEKVSNVIFTDEKFAAISSPLGQAKYLENLGIDDRILTLGHLFRSSDFYAFAVPKDHEELIRKELKEIIDEFAAANAATSSLANAATNEEGEEVDGGKKKKTEGEKTKSVDQRSNVAAATTPTSSEPEKDLPPQPPKLKKGGNKKPEPLITSDKIDELPDADEVMKESEVGGGGNSKKAESKSGPKHAKRKADEMSQLESGGGGGEEGVTNDGDGEADADQISSARKKKSKHR